MRTETAPTYTAAIFIAGDLATAKLVCREYCMRVGLCVTVEPTTYIYTGGEEAGVRVGLINYPRFPSEPEELRRKALDLANVLVARLCQHSFCVVFPDETIWRSLRTEGVADVRVSASPPQVERASSREEPEQPQPPIKSREAS
jgi:hypothetical protein